MTFRFNFMGLLVVALLAYVGLRLLGPFAWPMQAAGAAALAALFFMLPRGWHVPDGPLGPMVPWIATGFFSWLLVLTLVREVTAVLAWAALPREQLDAWIRHSAAAVLAFTPAITAIGYVMARRVARIVDVRVPVPGLPEGLEGFTIAQISDVHVGTTIKRDFVQGIVTRVNSLKADVVAITGDLVDGSVRQLSHHTAPLAELSSRHGTFVVTGNHEYYSGAHSWIRELEGYGHRVLLNEHVVIEHAGARIAIAGVTDFSAHHFDPEHRSDPRAALDGVPLDAVKVLLAHQPRTAPHAHEHGYHLQISGHTHGGQFWPWNHFVKLQQPFTAGLHRLGEMWIYISRGTGYWGPPMRFGSPSEITRITLTRA